MNTLRGKIIKILWFLYVLAAFVTVLMMIGDFCYETVMSFITVLIALGILYCIKSLDEETTRTWSAIGVIFKKLGMTQKDVRKEMFKIIEEVSENERKS